MPIFIDIDGDLINVNHIVKISEKEDDTCDILLTNTYIEHTKYSCSDLLRMLEKCIKIL